MNKYYVTEVVFTGEFDQPVFCKLSEVERVLTEDEIELRMVERNELYRLYSYTLRSAGFGPDVEAEVVERTYGIVNNRTELIKEICCKVIN